MTAMTTATTVNASTTTSARRIVLFMDTPRRDCGLVLNGFIWLLVHHLLRHIHPRIQALHAAIDASWHALNSDAQTEGGVGAASRRGDPPVGAAGAGGDWQQRRRSAQSGWQSRPMCEPFCAHPCAELKGDVRYECGGCTSAEFECRPASSGWPG